MKNLLVVFLCLFFVGCQFNQTTTRGIDSAPGNEVEIGRKALRFAESDQIDSLLTLFDKSANVSEKAIKPFLKIWKPTFNQYIFPDKSNIRVSKTVSKSIGSTQEFIAVIYPYTDGTNSPTKDFVITFLNEKIVKMELQETREIKIF